MEDKNDEQDCLIADENPLYGAIRTIENIGVHELTSSIKNKGQINLPFSDDDCDLEWAIPSCPLRDGGLNNMV